MVSVRIPIHSRNNPDLYAGVSIQDAQRALSIRWGVLRAGKKFYGFNHERKVLLHRFLLGAEKGREVDHKDGNGLNCARSNMRDCTRSQNAKNRLMSANNSSGFKGVHWRADKGKWAAEIACNGSRVRIGYFDNKKEAVLAYDRKAIELHGEYAKTNESLGLFYEP
jgi:hypothetical protein